MTFTEAAVEVLRLVGKPLHYKKITEIAIKRNLLAHIGKTPEITMSSRLATMVRKDRGEAPILKVKPGVFGLREFSQAILDVGDASDYDIDDKELAKIIKLADNDADSRSLTQVSDSIEEPAEPTVEDASLPEDELLSATESTETETDADDADESALFREEDGDDEPIFAKLDSHERSSSRSSDRPSQRRSRRRRSGGSDEASSHVNDESSWSDSRRSKGAAVQRVVDGLVSKDLAEAIETVLQGLPSQQLVAPTKIAEALIQRGRLSGSPSSLQSTIMAAVRGDIARRQTQSRRPRFRLAQGCVGLCAWLLPSEAIQAEHQAFRYAERQNESVMRTFLQHLERAPLSGFMELMATWLNAQGVVSLRGIDRSESSNQTFHLAGTLNQPSGDLPLAIVIMRGVPVERDHVIAMRGALHHYGQASAAWIITTSYVKASASTEAQAHGQSPVSLFDGVLLARAMERARVGIRHHFISMVSIDWDLFESLGLSFDDSSRSSRSRSSSALDGDSSDRRGGSRGRRRRRGGVGRGNGMRRGNGSAARQGSDSDEANASSASHAQTMSDERSEAEARPVVDTEASA